MNNDPQNERWVYPEGKNNAPQDNRAPADRAPQRAPRAAGRKPAPIKKKKKHSEMRAKIILFFVAFVVLFAVVAGIFAIFFFSTPDEDGSSMKITYGEDSFKVDKEFAYRDSKLYLSFTKIADYLDLSRTGDADSARFVFAAEAANAEGDGEEYVEFFRDDTRAIVSGTEIRMSAPSFFSGDEVFVPAEFLKQYVLGLTVDEDADKRTVLVEREKLAETQKNGKPVEADVTLALKASVAPKPIDIEDVSVDLTEVKFITDLSEYEQYMNPEDDSDFMILVNKTHPIGPEYVPDDLADVVNTRADRDVRLMRYVAEKALEALYIEMSAAGFTDVSVTSAYRSYEEQDYLYNSYVQSEMANGLTVEEAEAKADTYSARPGTSEHQTGLCCDMHNLPSADQSFAEEGAYAWLKENAWKFGFIERFPEGKDDVTGYSFEPWHYRFVGRKAAAVIYSRGITLEEYLEG